MESDLKQRFGRLVAAHRKRSGFTQAQLAEKADLSVDMIARIEGGNSGARFHTLQRLADAMNIDPAELFTAELPKSALSRPQLSAIYRRLAKQSDADLEWLAGMLDGLFSRR